MFGPGGAALASGTMGTAIAAGAATGAGIAALSGDDPLMGAVSGGLGGASGSGIGKAMSGTAAVAPTTANIPSGMYDAASPTLANAAGQLPAQNSALMAPSTGTNFGAGTMRNVTMPNTTQTVGSFGKPSDSTFLSRLGGGSELMGAGKLGVAGLPVLGAAAMPDTASPDSNPMNRYDPNRRLNLNMTTGIRNALMRNSGLRLQEGGILDLPMSAPEEMEAFRRFEQERQLRESMSPNMNKGGYLETGMGDGVSDEIPASLDGEQDVLLSENEFVVPADVVSGLGNGSSDAGAEQLYAMMDRVRKARTGTKKMGREINAERLMPA
ncbi:MAG: hypothetical protein Tp1100SUR639781_72 [Prokaryotic dsDNA virus sp.]|nr:MAG: hypothetical protein Tp1100SUR639781_72 [Prokaryotic dsDNA virus sp.]